MPDQRELIRRAGPDDADRVWSLVRQFAPSFDPKRAAFDDIWVQLVTGPRTLLLVANTAGGSIVGYLLGNSHLSLLTNGPVAWIEEVMVDQKYQRRGVGSQLIQHAEEWAQSIGAAYLSLASRRAGPFYTALDYEDAAVFYKKAIR